MKETKPTKSISIIPVGDDEVFGGSMADYHLGSEYFMAKATTGLDAITYFREIKPHLIIAKQRKPVIDGPEFHELTAKEGGLTAHIIASEEEIVQRTADVLTENKSVAKEVAERQVQENNVLMGRYEWEQIVNALPDMIVIVDRKHQITFVNQSMQERLEIHIADTGCGISESNRARVFEPFFTTKEVGRGAGQGLAISYDVVTRKHGGSLTFATIPGEGTTFTVRLPVKRANSIKKL